MNNRLKRAAFITAAAFLLSALTPYLSVIYKSQENITAQPVVKKEVNAEIVPAVQTEPIIERLTYACEENNNNEINSVCDLIQKEMDSAKNKVAEYSDDIESWASDDIKARQEDYENEFDVKYAETVKALAEIRNGVDIEKNVAVISSNIIEPKDQFTSDAAPNTETAAKDIESVADEHITQSVNINSPAPTDNDLKLECSADMEPVIVGLAEGLGDVNSIYRYVKDNIKMETYYGSKKGAVITLAQQGGNDIDQASLLIALLRAKGIPARFVTGTVRITAQQAIDITGAADENTAGRFIGTGFRNAKRIKDNGKVTGYMMTRTWVEAYVPYTDYRGAGNNAGDKVWVQLDPSFKKVENKIVNVEAEYTAEETKLISDINDFNKAHYENSTAIELPKEVPCYNREIVPSDNEKYLPSSLPYITISADERYSFIKDSDKDKISIGVDGETIMTAPVSELYGKPVILSYKPAHASDRDVMSHYDRLIDVPAYLVNVVPVVTVGDKEYKINDPDFGWLFETQLGTQHQMEVRIYDSGNTTMLVDNIISGSMYAINLDLQTISPDDVIASETRAENARDNFTSKNACDTDELGAILDLAGKYYFSLCDAQSIVNSSVMNIEKTRRLGVAVTGYRFARSASFGMVTNLDSGSFYIDVAYNTAATISLDGDTQKEKEFIFGTGNIESYYEGYIWEQIIDPSQTCISTESVMALAVKQGITPVMLAPSNAEEVLSKCNVTDDVKEEIRNFLNMGMYVELIPETLTIGDWTGTVYIALDRETGSASYMISGGTAGGSSMDVDDLFAINNSVFQLNFAMAEICMVTGYHTFMNGQMENNGEDIASGAHTMIGAAMTVASSMTALYENIDHACACIEEGEDGKAMEDYYTFTVNNLWGCFLNAVSLLAAGIQGLSKVGSELAKSAQDFKNANVLTVLSKIAGITSVIDATGGLGGIIDQITDVFKKDTDKRASDIIWLLWAAIGGVLTIRG